MLDPNNNSLPTEKGCSEPTHRHWGQSLPGKNSLMIPQTVPSFGVLCSMNQAVRTLFLLG